MSKENISVFKRIKFRMKLFEDIGFRKILGVFGFQGSKMMFNLSAQFRFNKPVIRLYKIHVTSRNYEYVMWLVNKCATEQERHLIQNHFQRSLSRRDVKAK